MFTRFARLPLRRCLHTASGAARSAPRYSGSTKVILGASAAAAATYMSWNMFSERNRLHLDSAVPSKSTPQDSQIPPGEQPSKIQPQESEFTPEPESVGEVDKASEGDDSEGEGEAQPPQSQGAYNPETGEINWDCSCLGGMAHGPCGEQFKEAFSCFVFSEDEPKGINCVDAFKRMQDCFREHPEHYADEIMKDDDEEPSPAPETTPEGAANIEREAVAEVPVPTESHSSEHRIEVPSSNPPSH